MTATLLHCCVCAYLGGCIPKGDFTASGHVVSILIQTTRETKIRDLQEGNRSVYVGMRKKQLDRQIWLPIHICTQHGEEHCVQPGQ